MRSTDEVWKQQQIYSTAITEHSRKLGFAVAAICWFFKSNSVTFPIFITFALACAILFFACDLIQYIKAEYEFKKFAENAEDEDFDNKPLDEMLEKQMPVISIKMPAHIDAERIRPWYRRKLFFLFSSFSFLIFEFLKRIVVEVLAAF